MLRSCFQHHNTIPIPLPSKMATKTMSGLYAVLISSGANQCGYSTLVFNGFSVHTYINTIFKHYKTNSEIILLKISHYKRQSVHKR